jgi:lipopolysaccharide biosynthesis protein
MPRFSRKRAKLSVITLADQARDQGQWERSARYYREALQRRPWNPPIWVQYGHVLKESGHWTDAERAYRTAIAYNPGSADAHLQLGHVLKIQGKKEEARTAYLRAVALDRSLNGVSFEFSQLGWSDKHLLALNSMLGNDAAADTDRLAGLNGTSTARVESRDRHSHSSLDFVEDQDVRLILESGLFDTTWYVGNEGAQITPSDAILHYLREGARKGRDPHAFFDTDWYLASNPDVAAAGINPLVHYLRSGAAEGRAPNPTLQSVFARSAEQRMVSTTPHRVSVPDLFEVRGLVPRGSIAIVLHLYYPDLWIEMREAIERIRQPFDLFVSLVKGSSEHMRPRIKQAFPNAHVFDFENRGRDIGPFLVLLQSGLLFQYELICKLHTKRSPHREDGSEWRGALISGVLGNPTQIDHIVSSFRSDPDIGMVVADGNIYRGHHHWASNEPILAKLLSRIGISPDVRDRAFPGGSIFWIRPLLLRTLEGAGIRIEDFEPEPVQEDGSLPHAVERMFGLICEDAGMRVVEASQLRESVRAPTDEADIHLIAFYLPQFHPIPENDKWWGPGFTEWTNVTRAKPLFAGHRQPRLPSDLSFYDLRLPEARATQAQLACRYGLAAFCYYYYWFNGRRILERPLNEMLVSGEPDFPFLICWANEPWTRNWDGLGRDILLPQTYEPGWTSRFASDIAPVLRDRRYFRLNGEPMLLIYRIGHIPDARAAMRELRAALSKQGVRRVHLAAAWVWFPEDDALPADPSALDLDAYFEIPPHWLPSQALQSMPSQLSAEFNGELYDYNRTVTVALGKLDEPVVGLRHRGVMTAWDSTARKGSRAAVFHAATPTSFRRWLRGTIAHACRQPGERVVFINAWNEWAEGTYLEPDTDFGCGWLEAMASAASANRRTVGQVMLAETSVDRHALSRD